MKTHTYTAKIGITENGQFDTRGFPQFTSSRKDRAVGKAICCWGNNAPRDAGCTLQIWRDGQYWQTLHVPAASAVA
jgi:hypothetical protein